jgi:hypothetical protein
MKHRSLAGPAVLSRLGRATEAKTCRAKKKDDATARGGFLAEAFARLARLCARGRPASGLTIVIEANLDEKVAGMVNGLVLEPMSLTFGGERGWKRAGPSAK